MRPSAKTGMRNEPPRLIVSLMLSISRAISLTRSLPSGRSVVPRVVSMTSVSKCPAGNFAPWSVRWFSNSTSPVKKIWRCLWWISTAAAPATWPAGWKMTSISSLRAAEFLGVAEGQADASACRSGRSRRG